MYLMIQHGESNNSGRDTQRIVMYDISVIIPIYNAEAYLAQTLGNVLNQSQKSLQIILVNDASTDGSLRIMQDARNAFGERVVVVDLEKNGGPGVARNVGLDMAEGKYIGFVDSDDIIDVTMYEKLFAAAIAENADIADCAYFRDSTKMALIHFSEECVGELDDEKRSILLSCGGYNCMKIFKKSLLDENNIRFRPVYVLEDMDFLVKAILCAKKVVGVQEVLYRYRDEVEGSLTKVKPVERDLGVQLEAMDAVYNAAKEYGNYDAIKEPIEYMLLSLYRNMLVRLAHEKNTLDYGRRKKYFSSIKEKRDALITGYPFSNRFVLGKMNDDDVGVIKAAEDGATTFLKI